MRLQVLNSKIELFRILKIFTILHYKYFRGLSEENVETLFKGSRITLEGYL